jgi:hypothetical protein
LNLESQLHEGHGDDDVEATSHANTVYCLSNINDCIMSI